MKITGLLRFQRSELKRKLAQKNIGGDFEIQFNDSISLRRLDSLWYGGNVVDVMYKGYTFHIEATGDVYADLYSVRGNNHLSYVKDINNAGNFGCEMLSYFRSDKVLSGALGQTHHTYQIELQYGNWWECFVTDSKGVFHDLMWATDADSLFDAIIEVTGSLDETIKHIEETA